MNMNLKLNKFKDHLPDIQTQSTSYGGQYYSDWIVIFHPGGSVTTTRFIVGWSINNKECPTEDAKWWTGTINGHCWRRCHRNSAWIYHKDLIEQFKIDSLDINVETSYN